MSDQQKRLAERFHKDIFEAGKLDVADEILSPNFAVHSPDYPPELPSGPEGVKQWAMGLRQGFPDVGFTHHDVIAEGDKVVIRWSVTGTHKGELLGMPATGKQIQVSGIDVFRVQDGRLVEMWQNMDTFGMMRSLGVIPETS